MKALLEGPYRTERGSAGCHRQPDLGTKNARLLRPQDAALPRSIL